MIDPINYERKLESSQFQYRFFERHLIRQFITATIYMGRYVDYEA